MLISTFDQMEINTCYSTILDHFYKNKDRHGGHEKSNGDQIDSENDDRSQLEFLVNEHSKDPDRQGRLNQSNANAIDTDILENRR